MKFPYRERRGASDDHLIPLINVVFLMLIFFMVIGRIAPTDRFPVQPPTSRSQQTAVEYSVTISIAANGSLAVADTPVTLETLIPTLEASLAATGENQIGTAEIHLKADAALTTGQLAPILEQLRNSGNSKVRLLTGATE